MTVVTASSYSWRRNAAEAQYGRENVSIEHSIEQELSAKGKHKMRVIHGPNADADH